MASSGAFGFKIGKKTRLMHVESHADILWQTCVRELYILMKHYGTTVALCEAFKNLKDARGKPTRDAVEKCKYFADIKQQNPTDCWPDLLHFCQHSYINILESGYFLNNGIKLGLIFLLDLNNNSAQFYEIDKSGKVHEYEKATLDEIMEFEDMPTNTTLATIIDEMKHRYIAYSTKINSINDELHKIQNIIDKTKEMGADQNIIIKANNLKDTLLWERKKVEMEYRFFYHRLNVLDLIEH